MEPTEKLATFADTTPSTDNASLRPFLIGCCIFLVVLEVLGFLLTRHLSNSPDFRAFYAAGALVRQHPSQLFNLAAQKDIQDSLISPAARSLPFYHPAFEAVLFAPLSFLPFRAAYLLFIAANLLLLIATVYVSRPLFLQTIPLLQPRPAFIFFLFAPLILAVLHGQDSVLFLLLCAWAWRLLEEDRDGAAGCVIAFGLFRLQLALPLAVLLALRRGWRFTSAFTLTGIGLVLLSIAITGWAGTQDFIHLLNGASLVGNQTMAFQNAMGIHPLAAPNLSGMLTAFGTANLPARTAFLISACVSLVVFVFAAVRVRLANTLAAAFALAVITCLLVSQHANPHDATLLLVPMTLLVATPARYVLAACYYLPAALLLFVGPNSFFLLAMPLVVLLCLPDREAGLAPAH